MERGFGFELSAPWMALATNSNKTIVESTRGSMRASLIEALGGSEEERRDWAGSKPEAWSGFTPALNHSYLMLPLFSGLSVAELRILSMWSSRSFRKKRQH